MDIIFDIDGTLADLTHRRHWVTTKPKNWPAFDKGIPNDSPHKDIIYLNNLLASAGHRIFLVSGRSSRTRAETLMWLGNNGVQFFALMMRQDGDHRSDDIVKEEILDELLRQGYNPEMVFDDRDRVVAMWRRRGIRTLQVAPGDF